MTLHVALLGFISTVAVAADPSSTTKPAIDQLMPFNLAGQWGFVARDAKTAAFVLPPAYELAFPFRYGLAAVRKDGAWGFIDQQGTLRIGHQYQEVQHGTFRAGVAVVKKNNALGVIGIDGKEILPFKHLRISVDDKAGRIVATMPNPADPDSFDGLVGLYDLAGKELMPPEYAEIWPWFKDGVTSVAKGGKRALANADGKLITPLQYDQMLHVDISHFIAVKGDQDAREKLHDLYDAGGKLLFSATYPYVGALDEGRAVFKDASSRLNGYLDEKGKVVIPAQFVMSGRFADGLAIVQRTTGGTIEAIDPAGNTVALVTDAFIRFDRFKNGQVWLAARGDKKIYLHDRKLKRMFPQGFYYAGEYDDNGLAVAQVDSKQHGLINRRGEWVVQPEWTGIERSSIAGQYIVSKGKERAMVDTTGKLLFKPQEVNLSKWDDQFIKIGPPGFLPGEEYYCFWRGDGSYFYLQTKPE